MNVLLLAEVSAAHVIGGAERVVRAQMIGLGRLGHHMAAVTRAPANDLRSTVLIDGQQERRYFPTESNAVLYVLSSISRSIKAFDAVSTEIRPESVLIHQALAGLGPVVARKGRTPTWIYVCHSLAHEEYESRNVQPCGIMARGVYRLHRWLRFWVERFVMRRCTGVVVLSEYMKQRVQHVHRMTAESIHVLPGGVDTTRFRPAEHQASVRERLGLPPEKFLFVTVRNLVPRMGLEALIDAVAAIREDAKDCLFLLGGEGPLKQSLTDLILREGIAELIKLLGFVPEDLLPGYYQAADAVLMPTRELEGFGLVTIEALACGTPVLGTPVGGIPEILRQVDPALVAEGTDSHSLAKALRALLDKFRHCPGERERLSLKGLELVRQRYTWELHMERLTHVLMAKGTKSVA